MRIRKNPAMLAALFILAGIGVALRLYQVPSGWHILALMAVGISLSSKPTLIKNDMVQVGWSKIPRNSINHIDLSAPDQIIIQVKSGRHHNFLGLHYHPKDWALFRRKMENWAA